jgi:hypothetical protein
MQHQCSPCPHALFEVLLSHRALLTAACLAHPNLPPEHVSHHPLALPPLLPSPMFVPQYTYNLQTCLLARLATASSPSSACYSSIAALL